MGLTWVGTVDEFVVTGAFDAEAVVTGAGWAGVADCAGGEFGTAIVCPAGEVVVICGAWGATCGCGVDIMY
jgi:hypothetical protein